MKCPECGSTNVTRYSNNALDCVACGHSARSQDFGAKCTCDQPHRRPIRYCAVHGEVVVSMD